MKRPRVVIVGGGITGLTAAYHMKQLFERGTVECILLEGSSRVGGKILTYREDNLILELGADSVVEHIAAHDLIRNLGVQSEIVPSPADAEHSYILSEKRPVPVPAPLYFGIPADWRVVWRTPLVSPKGKWRVMLDYLAPRSNHESTADPEPSLGAFLRRRLGDEWTTEVCEPLLSAAFAANLDDLGLSATYPELSQLETRYRSVLHGARQTEFKDRFQRHLLTLRNGMQTVTERLFDELRDFADIRTDSPVTKIQRFENGQYTVETSVRDTTEVILADAVVVAAPAPVAGQLLCSLSAKAAKLSAIRYVSTGTVFLGYPAETVMEFPGTEVFVPPSASADVTKITVTSRRWPHLTRDERIIVRVDVGRRGQQNWLGMEDTNLMARIEDNVQRILGISAKPWFRKLTRWEKGIPQYEVGHLALVAEVEEHLKVDAPGVFLAGAAYHGITVPECVQSGLLAAEKTAAWVKA